MPKQSTASGISKNIYRLPKNLLTRTPAKNQLDVMRIDSYDYWYSLDGLSARLYSSFDGKKTLDQHLALLEKKYETPKEWPRFAVQLVKQLVKEGLLEEV